MSLLNETSPGTQWPLSIMIDCGHKANESSRCTRWPFRQTNALAPDTITMIIIIIIVKFS